MTPRRQNAKYETQNNEKIPRCVQSGSAEHVCLFLQLTERLTSLAEESHNTQMKKLKDICDK